MVTPSADESTSHFAELAVQYYVSGRWAAIGQMLPVLGNLLHHSIEMSLKAALAATMSMRDLRSLGHDLPKIWRTFRAKFPDSELSQFDSTVSALHKFEELRYPDAIMAKGAMIQLAIFREHVGIDRPQLADTPSYLLVLEDIDALQARILATANINPSFFTAGMTSDAKHYLLMHNRHASEW